MKNINLSIAILFISLLAFTTQSCKKDSVPTPVIYAAAVPANPTPAVAAVVPLAGTSYTLTWEGNATSTWDVYVGTSASPPLAQAGVTGNSYTYTTATGGEFFWYVRTKDAHNVVSISPTWSFYINSAPTVPVLTVPKADSVGFPVNGALEWTSTDAEGDIITYLIYMGTSADTLAIAGADTADLTFSPQMTASTKYYWKVVAKDSHGATSTSIVKSFTTGLPSAEPIMVFTGDYTADEPAESYSYDVSFAFDSPTTITTDNYWNSGWVAVFTIDLTNLTYSMPATTWSSGYSGIESGIVDPTTGTMTGTYTIFQNGVNIEQGVHTYTKK